MRPARLASLLALSLLGCRATADTCASLDLNNCALMGATPLPTGNCTVNSAADPCTYVSCCQWEPVYIDNSLSPSISVSACPAPDGFCLNTPLTDLPAANPAVAFGLLPLPTITDKCLAVQAAAAAAKKKLGDKVTGIIKGITDAVTGGGLSASIAACVIDCTALFAIGYTGGSAILNQRAQGKAGEAIDPITAGEAVTLPMPSVT